MPYIDQPVVKSSEVNQALKRDSNAKIKIEDTAVRALADQTTVGSTVRWSDFVGARILTADTVNFGLNLNFNWLLVLSSS